MVIIKWINKYSGETGYVAAISSKNRCFVNTYDRDMAKGYSEKAVKGMISKLESFGEAENNEFEILSV